MIIHDIFSTFVYQNFVLYRMVNLLFRILPSYKKISAYRIFRAKNLFLPYRRYLCFMAQNVGQTVYNNATFLRLHFLPDLFTYPNTRIEISHIYSICLLYLVLNVIKFYVPLVKKERHMNHSYKNIWQNSGESRPDYIFF